MLKFPSERLFLFLLIFFNLILRVFRINQPPIAFLNEKFGVPPIAHNILAGLGDTGPSTPLSPLGKLLFVFSLKILGDNPLGWRLLPALFSITSVVLTYFLAKQMFKSRFIASFASILITLDFMWFVHSRFGDLETLMATFILLSLIFVWRVISEGEKIWAFASGITFGLALLVKFQAFLVLMASILLIIFFAKAKLKDRIIYSALIIITSSCIYLIAYFPVIAKGGINQFFSLHKYSFYFYSVWVPNNYQRLAREMGYEARLAEIDNYYRYPITWLTNPKGLYFELTTGKRKQVIIDTYNPAIFFPGLAAFIIGLFVWLRTKDKRLIFLLLIPTFTYLPLVISSLIKPLFYNQYYLLTAMPLLSILIAWTIKKIYKRTPALVFIYLAVVILFFIFYYPLLSAMPVDIKYLHLLTPY